MKYNFYTTDFYKILILRLCCVILVLTCCCTNVEAKRKRTKGQQAYGVIDPDPVPVRSKPIRHNKALAKPSFGKHRGGGETSTMEGIDLSHHNGHLDWDALAKDSHSGFVYLKATEHGTFVDNMYAHNIAEARRVGIKVGSYHFFRPNVSGREQFENFMRVVDKRKQDLLPCVDVEIEPRGISLQVFWSRLKEMCDLLEREYGTKPLIYTGQYYYKDYLYNSPLRGKYPLWVARYSNTPPRLEDDDDFIIWQYTETGHANGVRGYVDLNRFVKGHSLRDLMYR